MTQKMNVEELVELEEGIRSAKDHLEGALSMVQDPYARSNLHNFLATLVYSANKWLDHCVEENGRVPSVSHRHKAGRGSRSISGGETANES